MSYLYTGQKGISLKEIIGILGNKNYDFIDFMRRRVDENGEEQTENRINAVSARDAASRSFHSADLKSASTERIQ